MSLACMCIVLKSSSEIAVRHIIYIFMVFTVFEQSHIRPEKKLIRIRTMGKILAYDEIITKFNIQ